jgi:hypothetical protein
MGSPQGGACAAKTKTRKNCIGFTGITVRAISTAYTLAAAVVDTGHGSRVGGARHLGAPTLAKSQLLNLRFAGAEGRESNAEE